MADSTVPPLPPANFLFLIESVLMQAQMQLGLFNVGEGKDDESQPDLAMARHSIDLLGMLQEKTKGNLTMEEQRLIDNGLTELRFRFVQVADDLKRKASGEVTAPQEGTKEEDAPRIITADGGKGSKTE